VPAEDALDRVAFAYSPLQEAVLSLHVLVAPKHHALQHDWVREMRSLPASLKKRIAEFAFAYRWTMPGFVTASPEEVFSDFEQDLRELAAHDSDTLALDFLRPLYDHAGTRETGLLEDETIRRHALGQCGRHGASPELVTLIFDDPAELGRRFAALLTDYWDAAFSEEWARLEPKLTEAVTQAGREIALDGLYSFVRGLSSRLRVDPESEEFGLDLPHDHRVLVTVERKLVLVPSAFVWPHVRVNCDEPWPLTLVYPAKFVLEAARPQHPVGRSRSGSRRTWKRDAAARPEARHGAPSLDAGARAPRRPHAGRDVEAPTEARGCGARRDEARGLLRPLQRRRGAPAPALGDAHRVSGSDALAGMCARQSIVRSVRKSAVKPSTRLTAMIVIRMPTLNASRAERDAWSRSR
jgi:hypothetical protein